MRMLVLCGAMILSACAQHVRQAPLHYHVDHAFTVQLDRPWADVTRAASPHLSNHVHLLTIHGQALESLYVVGGLKAGDPLWQAAHGEENPRYRADFSRSEIVEFIDASLAALGYVSVTAHNIRPSALANRNGVRFDIETQTTEGLDISGAALAAQTGDRLALILFLAPREHYFPMLAPEIDRMMVAAASG